ncbi:MAG: ABC-F family ATP-binding cassette domain-containing protein [Raoultibacter sp.]
MAFLLGCEKVGLEFPTKQVFDAVTVGVNEGDRVGIVGRNGDGKSTMLALLAGLVTPDTGRVTQRNGITIGLLGQADSLDPEQSIAHEVVGDIPEYVWASDPQIREIISGLIGDLAWEGRVGDLSGGQRRRVDLVRLLIGDWDVLMLDEPTNHLDIRAITWLAAYLKRRWKKGAGALLVVTHDRWFLDEVCTNMWEVHDRQIDPFEGGYSAYVLQRVERDRQVQAIEQKRQNMMRKELAWLSRGARARATKPKFHVELARDLIDGDPPIRNEIELKQMAMARLGKQVIDVLGVSERLGGKTQLDDVTWLIGPGDRYGILGENGAGKTTLLRVIQGLLAPTEGRVKIGKTVKFAVLSQHLEELEQYSTDRVREVVGRYKTRFVVDGKEVSSGQLLERLGFTKDQLKARVQDLSGGQKRRFQFLLILLEEPNVLILDEPGNDLDTDMLAVMEDLLDAWPGTLLMVTHDRYLMERVTDQQFALLDGKVRHLPGGVDEYLRELDERDSLTERAAADRARKEEARAAQGAAKRDSVVSTEKSSQVNVSASATTLTGGDAHKAKKQMASNERKLATLNDKIEAARASMIDVDPSDYVALGEVQATIRDLESQVTALEEEWIKLAEALGV